MALKVTASIGNNHFSAEGDFALDANFLAALQAWLGPKAAQGLSAEDSAKSAAMNATLGASAADLLNAEQAQSQP